MTLLIVNSVFITTAIVKVHIIASSLVKSTAVRQPASSSAITTSTSTAPKIVIITTAISLRSHDVYHRFFQLLAHLHTVHRTHHGEHGPGPRNVALSLLPVVDDFLHGKDALLMTVIVIRQPDGLEHRDVVFRQPRHLPHWIGELHP